MKRQLHMVQLKVVSADLSALLFNLNISGIVLHHVLRVDELTATFCIPQQQKQMAVDIIEQNGGKIEKSVPASGILLLQGFLRRPVLVFAAALLCFMSCFLPSRVLFITVVGNESIPKQQILDAASICGIRFGAVRREIRSENVKNHLLEELPDLKWVGVNTSGCVAQIAVQERRLPEMQPNLPVVSSVIAASDGVISDMTVKSGTPLCRVGQAVKRGQLLVSGYSDCGRCLYGTRADAEIYAQTKRSLILSLLTDGVKRESHIGGERKIGLIIGKKRINFYKGSGISDTTCVRMYVEYPVTLPGGFQLPVALTVQSKSDYDTVPIRGVSPKAESILKNFALSYLESQMIAGKVEQEECYITQMHDALHMTGQYICNEMIGQTHSEEIVDNNEQTD